MPNVNFTHPALARLLPQYELIADVLAGETAIKAKRQAYLPVPNACDESEENMARYEAYLKRAVFYNASRRTLSGMVGQLFLTEPVVEVPDILDVLKTNATGAGAGIDQLAKQAASYTLAFGRAGILADYPVAGETVTRADLISGRIRPTLKVFNPKEIINWRTAAHGAEDVLTLVVIREGFTAFDDGFEIKTADQWRVLSLDGEGYAVEIWRKDDKGSYSVHERYQPTDYRGQRLQRIPFSFVGSVNNDANPDNPEFYDLASLNIAHYRNSADYEESAFLIGQPTPVFTGLTQEWVDEVLRGQVELGSRGGVTLPEGAGALLLQASPNGLAKEAMDSKERQMVALGARLVENRDTQATATQVGIEAASQNSVLANTGNNVASAFTQALRFAAQFTGEFNLDDIYYELNTRFDTALIGSEERTAIVEIWQKGGITFEEMRNGLRKAGLAYMDDEEAKEVIDAEQSKNMPSFNFGGLD